MSLANAIMDLILMGLLAVAIWVGLRVHKNLTALRAGQEQFARVVHELDAAAIRAHHSLKELRANADESQDLLHGRILAARELMQRLEQQVTRAERTQRDLETGMTNAAALATLATRPVTAMPNLPAPEPLDLRAENMMGRRTAAPVPTPAARGPFDRDMVKADDPLPTPSARPAARPAASRLPEPEVDDGEHETELLEKVHMSELVVANLNEMIRSLNLPTRQPRKAAPTVEEDLFGDGFQK